MKNQTSGKSLGFGKIIFASVAATAFFLFLLRSDVAIDYMKKGLKLCTLTVIPSLFPFMVISELIVSSGLGYRLGRLFAKPMKLIFGVGESGACAFFLGSLCGFPIGAKTLCAMYDSGQITRREFSRVMTFCNNPGSAFVISAVGVSLLGSKSIGITLYVCVLLSAVIVGSAGRLFFGKTDRQKDREEASICFRSQSITQNTGISDFVSAIQSSATSMLNVCSFVAFFSSFVGCLGAILSGFDIPAPVLSAVFGFFEISSGVGMAAELPSSAMAVLFCAGALGWSGLSVHFQIMTICSGRGISFKPYFWAKGAQAVISATLTGIALKILPFSEDAFAEMAQYTSRQEFYSNAAFVCCVFFAAGVLPIILNIRKKRIK